MLEDEEREGEEAEKRLDAVELRPGMEPLTPEEKERFLARDGPKGAPSQVKSNTRCLAHLLSQWSRLLPIVM